MKYREIEFRDKYNKPVWSLQRSIFGIIWKTIAIAYYTNGIRLSSEHQFNNKAVFDESVCTYLDHLEAQRKKLQTKILAKKFKPIILAKYEID